MRSHWRLPHGKRCEQSYVCEIINWQSWWGCAVESKNQQPGEYLTATVIAWEAQNHGPEEGLVPNVCCRGRRGRTWRWALAPERLRECGTSKRNMAGRTTDIARLGGKHCRLLRVDPVGQQTKPSGTQTKTSIRYLMIKTRKILPTENRLAFNTIQRLFRGDFFKWDIIADNIILDSGTQHDSIRVLLQNGHHHKSS